MKIFVISICILTSCLYISAQTNENDINVLKKTILSEFDILFSGITPEEYYKDYSPQIIPEYFLLGTLDYSIRPGGLVYPDIDIYNKNQEYKVNFLKQYILDQFEINIQIKKNDYGLFYLHSPELMAILYGYFNEEGKDLRTDIFNTKEQIGSFLLGTYFRYGGKRDKTYSLSFSINSKLIFSLLRDMECKKILFLESASAIGGGYGGFDFYPSVLLKKYLDVYLTMNEKMHSYEQASSPKDKTSVKSEKEKEYRKIYEQEMIRQEKVIEEAFGIYEHFRNIKQ